MIPEPIISRLLDWREVARASGSLKQNVVLSASIEVLSMLWSIDKRRRGHVTSRRMTGKLAPLCDQHFAPMRSSSTLALIFHGCTGDQFCERRYDVSIGYYGGTSPTVTYRVVCGTHFCTLFVCAYDDDRQIRRYACPMEGCKNETTWPRASLAV